MMEYIRHKYKGFLVFLFWIAVWQVSAMIISQSLFLPTPIESVSVLINIVPTLSFWRDVAATFSRVISGLAISLVGGFTLAVLARFSSIVMELISPIMNLVKTIPVMSFILLFLVFIKSNFVPIIVCTMVCLPIAFTNISEGLKNVDEKLVEMGKVFSLKKYKIFTKIIFPQLKPYINSAVILCVGFSWKTVVTTEVLSIPASSIGYNLYISKTYLDIPTLFAWTIAIVLISLFVEKVVRKIFKISKEKSL